MKILLAHGVFGFGEIGPFEYFNGIARHLEQTFPGVQVFAAQVNPIGSVAERAAKLAQQIVSVAGGDKVHIFGYSMGGLDARYALSNNLSQVKDHVARLVMIGTPNLGSPIADAIASGHVPPLFHPAHPIVVAINQPALHDLTTDVATQSDKLMHDVEGITYQHVAGDRTAVGAHASRALRAVAAFFRLPLPNDGIVPFDSATTRVGERQQPIAIWPTDHIGEVGWNLDNPEPVFLAGGIPNPFADRSHLALWERLV